MDNPTIRKFHGSKPHELYQPVTRALQNATQQNATQQNPAQIRTKTYQKPIQNGVVSGEVPLETNGIIQRNPAFREAMKSNPTTPLVEISTDLTRLGSDTYGSATMLVLDKNKNGLRDTDEPTAFGIKAEQTTQTVHPDNRTDGYQSELTITGALINGNLTGEAQTNTQETNRNNSGGIYKQQNYQDQSPLSNADTQSITPLLQQLGTQSLVQGD